MSRLSDFSQSFHRHFTRDPNACVALGVERNADRLPDPSLEYAEDVTREASLLLDSLESNRTGEIGFDDSLDLDLAEMALESEIFRNSYGWADQNRLQQTPSAGDDIGDGIFLMFVNDPRPAAERLANITSRLEAVPGYLTALLRRLERPVARWVDMDVEKVDGLASLFESIENWAEEEGAPDRARLARARSKAETALVDYVRVLREKPAHSDIHLGEASARRIVALRGIDQSLESLHVMARDFLAENAAMLEELRGKLAKRHGLPIHASVESVEKFLDSRFALDVGADDLDRVLDRYTVEREKVLAFIRERDLFPVLADQDMKIMRTPGFMTPSIPAGAMMSPPPFREGTHTSLIYLTLSQELLREHTELAIPSMMIHEGIPGHHLQLATASTHPSLIRRHIEAMDQAEGWTTMLEDYMLDLGYMGELGDEARFSGKRDIARIGARVAIDLFFMTGDRNYLDVGVTCDTSSTDPFEAAGNLLQAVTGFVPGRVQAELNWYSQERGYPLSYLTGNQLVWQLKRDVEASQRGKLEGRALDRVFHDVFLHAGNMPVRHLREVYRERGLLDD